MVEKQGPCKWCRKEGMCCTQKNDLFIHWKGHENGCDGTLGGLTRFECVLKPKNTESKGWLWNQW